MPSVAIMNGIGTSMPQTSKMSKAAFFRTRSPPVDASGSTSRTSRTPQRVPLDISVDTRGHYAARAGPSSAGGSSTYSRDRDPYGTPISSTKVAGVSSSGSQRRAPPHGASPLYEDLSDPFAVSSGFGSRSNLNNYGSPTAAGPSGYAQLEEEEDADDDRNSPYRGGGGNDDSYTSIPRPSRNRTRSRNRRPAEPHIDARALASPPPHERARPPTEDSHGSGQSRSDSSAGISGFGMNGSSALSSSTSTVATGFTNVTTVTALTSPTSSNDEMLMALLAGQAAVDCDSMAIGGWEQVDQWKKEIILLSNRLDTLQSKHQREVKILQAAKTLQKLNQTNKRMSKQTMDSLEQSERRAEAAEKEVLILRDREAALRRRLMEHWAGVMAWEVRRLERSATEAGKRHELVATQADAARQREQELNERIMALESERHAHGAQLRELESNASSSQELEAARASERALSSQVASLQAERDQHAQAVTKLETERDRHAARISELEEMVLELGRRERAMEDDARERGEVQQRHEEERSQWKRELQELTAEKSNWLSERDTHSRAMDTHATDRDAWTNERQQLIAERDDLHASHGRLQEQFMNLQTEQMGRSGTWATERDQIMSDHDNLRTQLEQVAAERDKAFAERDMMAGELDDVAAERDHLSDQHRLLTNERDNLHGERNQLIAERTDLNSERSRMVEASGRMSSLDRETIDHIARTVAGMLGQRGSIEESELVHAVEDARALLDRRNQEVAGLKDEMAEVNQGFEEQVRKLGEDRDLWKAKAETQLRSAEASTQSSRAIQNEMTDLVRKIRAQNEEIAELKARNGQGAAPTSRGVGFGSFSVGTGDKAMGAKVQALEAELAHNSEQMAAAWRIIPAPKARAEAGLNNPNVVSPNAAVDFAALQMAYSGPTGEGFPGIDQLVTRIRGLVDDGRLMVERMARMEVEKDRHKANAAKAAKLVEDSQVSLATYKKQVEDLQDRLRNSATSEPNAQDAAELDHLRSEVDHLRDALDRAHQEHTNVTNELQEARDHVDMLSARTLSMAEDAEEEKRAIRAGLKDELEGLRTKLASEQDDAARERNASQMQHLQLLDELNSLQAEVGQLRQKLRATGATR